MSGITDLMHSQEQSPIPRAPAACGFVPGVVTENNQKNYAGMVKVEFVAWEKGKNICDWLPLLHPYAGKTYGSYLLPEVGDQVLVGFLGGDWKRPFVLGSFFPADARMAGESFDPKNANKRLRTKGGVEVTFSDEEKRESVVLTTPKGLTLKLEDETERVTVSDEKGQNLLRIDCKNGAVTVSAKSSIELSAGGASIKLDGQGNKCTVSCGQLELSASQTAKLSANQALTLEGGMLKAEGKQTAALKGGAMTEVSGGMLKLN